MFKNKFFKKVASCCLTLAGVLSLSMPCNAHIYGTDSYCDNEWKSFLSNFYDQKDFWEKDVCFKNEKIQFYWCHNNSEYLNVFYVNSDCSYHKNDYYDSSEELYGNVVRQNLNEDDYKCSFFIILTFQNLLKIFS